MESYLNPLEEEWETLGSTAGEFDGGSLKALAGVSANAPESTFQDFRKPYYAARKILVELLTRKRTGALERRTAAATPTARMPIAAASHGGRATRRRRQGRGSSGTR